MFAHITLSACAAADKPSRDGRQGKAQNRLRTSDPAEHAALAGERTQLKVPFSGGRWRLAGTCNTRRHALLHHRMMRPGPFISYHIETESRQIFPEASLSAGIYSDLYCSLIICVLHKSFRLPPPDTHPRLPSKSRRKSCSCIFAAVPLLVNIQSILNFTGDGTMLFTENCRCVADDAPWQSIVSEFI